MGMFLDGVSVMKKKKRMKRRKKNKKNENQTLDFTIESLYPFLDPEGRGHVEHAILIEYIQGHVSNISSTDNTELQHSQHKLDKVLRKKIKMEKKARKKWTHQPALMVASWYNMNQYVFSGVPDHHWSNMSTNISTNISANISTASSAAVSAPSPKERLSVSLDVNSMYGTSPNPIHTESILKKKGVKKNFPQKKKKKKKKKS